MSTAKSSPTLSLYNRQSRYGWYYISEMVRLLFWNVKGMQNGKKLERSDYRFQNLESVLAAAARQRSLDIIILAESPFEGQLSLLDFQTATTGLIPSRQTKVELEIYYRKDALNLAQISTLMKRATFQSVNILSSKKSFLLVTVHLESHRLVHRVEARKEAVRTLAAEVERVEHDRGNVRDTIIVGDFNYDPFDLPFHLRSVSAKLKAEEKGLFYNPMWAHFGDAKGTLPGTYYYDSKASDCPFWHIFDQVLLRPELLPVWREKRLKILHKLGKHQLITDKSIPDDRNYSDHLPIYFEIDL